MKTAKAFQEGADVIAQSKCPGSFVNTGRKRLAEQRGTNSKPHLLGAFLAGQVDLCGLQRRRLAEPVTRMLTQSGIVARKLCAIRSQGGAVRRGQLAQCTFEGNAFSRLSPPEVPGVTILVQ
eukprot:2642004-Rhodomonas_salina.4